MIIISWSSLIIALSPTVPVPLCERVSAKPDHRNINHYRKNATNNSVERFPADFPRTFMNVVGEGCGNWRHF